MRPWIWRVGGRDRGVFFQLAEHEHRHLSFLLHRSSGHGDRCVKEADAPFGNACKEKEKKKRENNESESIGSNLSFPSTFQSDTGSRNPRGSRISKTRSSTASKIK